MKSAMKVAALASCLSGTAVFSDGAGAVDPVNHFLLSSRGCERASSWPGTSSNGAAGARSSSFRASMRCGPAPGA